MSDTLRERGSKSESVTDIYIEKEGQRVREQERENVSDTQREKVCDSYRERARGEESVNDS